MISAIILAAGKGTRINSKTINKVALPFLKKPMIKYGVEVLEGLVSPTIIVVGAFSESVKQALKEYDVIYAYQKKRLGTGHAVKIGLDVLNKNYALVLVGYGDHMMFYKKKTIEKLIDYHRKNRAKVSFISTKYHDPMSLVWGRIVRNKRGKILDIVEQKDADEKQKKIREVNAGFYCFNFKFLKKQIKTLKKSKASGEYYITNIVKEAVKMNEKVVALVVRFREVGIGINKNEELRESQNIYLKNRA